MSELLTGYMTDRELHDLAQDREQGTAAAVSTERDILVAYLVDRREQYTAASGIYCAIGELIVGIQRGDHDVAHAHGEYDDILADRTVWPWRNVG
jgi:hypothetical protein